MNEPTSDPNADNGEQATGTQSAAEIRAAVEREMKENLQAALEGNEGYKGLQRAFAKSDQQHRTQLSQKDAELAALKAQAQELQNGLEFLSTEFISALPDADRAAMAEKLRNRQMQGLEKQISTLRQAITAPPPQQNVEQADYTEQLKQVLAEARDALEETAKERGFDPKDKALDFGDETQTFAARLKKLNASMKKHDEADVDSVRPKVDPTPTRTGGGAAVGNYTGKDIFEQATDEIWAKMQLQARNPGRKR